MEINRNTIAESKSSISTFEFTSNNQITPPKREVINGDTKRAEGISIRCFILIYDTLFLNSACY